MGFFSKIMNKFGYRKINNAYFKGAGGGSMWEWITSATTIDNQIRNDIAKLRAHARDLSHNNPVVRQYLQLISQNVIGSKGMTLQAQVRNNAGKLNKPINDKIESAWAEFWKSPFVDGKQSGISGESTLIKSVARDGEVFVRKCIGRQFNKFAFALQVIDPDLVDHEFNRPASDGQNEIRLGIEVDEWSRALAIHIWSHHPQDLNRSTPQKRIRIPASEIIHLFDPERANQTRGITWMNSVMASLKHLDGFMEAEIIAARTGACAFPLFEHTDLNQSVDEKSVDYSLELNPGTGMTLPAGLKLSEWKPNHPNINVGEFVKACLRFFSSGVHVSYNALSNDLEGVNYSSIRSGLLVERDRWKVLQEWWISAFRQPVYEAWLTCSLLSGALTLDSRDPAKFRNVKWTARGWQWVDPLKDVNAAVVAINNGLGSRTSALSEKGQDFEEICEELEDENQIAQSRGLVFGIDAKHAAEALKQAQADDDSEEEKATDKKRVQALMLAHRRSANE